MRSNIILKALDMAGIISRAEMCAKILEKGQNISQKDCGDAEKIRFGTAEHGEIHGIRFRDQSCLLWIEDVLWVGHVTPDEFYTIRRVNGKIKSNV